MTRGYWYISYGDKRFLKETLISARSLKEVAPQARLALLTDRDSVEAREVFEIVDVDPGLQPKTKEEGLIDGKFEGKLYNLHRSPFDWTFCVDTDTFFFENCDHLFGLMNWFDLAVCQSEGERRIYWPHPPHQVMEGLNVYTNGVMVFRKSKAMLEVFKNAAKYYRQNRHLYKHKGTNAHTTAAIAEHPSLRVYTLPINYNARVRGRIALTGSVKICHSSTGKKKMSRDDYLAVKEKINAEVGYRIWR